MDSQHVKKVYYGIVPKGYGEKGKVRKGNFTHMNILNCWHCGEPTIARSDKGTLRCFCDTCTNKHSEQVENNKNEYVRLKIEVMFERALRMMEKSGRVSINQYYEAAEAVHDLARKEPNKFDSSHEMMAVMELLKNRIRCKVQFKVNNRRVDILLPDLKVALEIDGALHKFRIGKDSERDIEILNALNKDDSGWEIVRIPTKFIENNLPRLLKAIKAISKEKRELRAKNGGFIPSYYSRHNALAQIKALEDVDDYTKQQLKENVLSMDTFND